MFFENMFGDSHKYIIHVYMGHGAHTREEQEHADEDINANDNI